MSFLEDLKKFKQKKEVPIPPRTTDVKPPKRKQAPPRKKEPRRQHHQEPTPIITSMPVKKASELTDDERHAINDLHVAIIQFSRVFLNKKLIRPDDVPYILVNTYPYFNWDLMRTNEKLTFKKGTNRFDIVN